jgi:hypothetical protein
MAIFFKTIETRTVLSDAIAASSTENTITSTLRVDAYNTLLVQNFDASCDIEVRLNDLTASSVQERFFVSKGGGFINFGIDADIFFNKVFLVNLSSTTAATDDKILVRASKVEPAKGGVFDIPTFTPALGVR